MTSDPVPLRRDRLRPWLSEKARVCGSARAFVRFAATPIDNSCGGSFDHPREYSEPRAALCSHGGLGDPALGLTGGLAGRGSPVAA